MLKLSLPALFLPAIAAVAIVAAGCNLIGQGELNVQNDQSGLASSAIFRAFEHEEGDFFPPEGWMAVGVLGGDLGDPPDYGMDGFLYLVSTDLACPQTEAGPEVYAPEDVVVHGVATVTNGEVKAIVLVPDLEVNRREYWALMEITPFPDADGGHYIHRCGPVEWSG